MLVWETPPHVPSAAAFNSFAISYDLKYPQERFKKFSFFLLEAVSRPQLPHGQGQLPWCLQGMSCTPATGMGLTGAPRQSILCLLSPVPISAQVTPGHNPGPGVPSSFGHAGEGRVTHSPGSAGQLPIQSHPAAPPLSSDPNNKNRLRTRETQLQQWASEETGGVRSFFLSFSPCLGQGPGPSWRPQVLLYPRAHLRPQPMELPAPPCPARPAPLTKPPKRPQNTPACSAVPPPALQGLADKPSTNLKYRRTASKSAFSFLPHQLPFFTCFFHARNISFCFSKAAKETGTLLESWLLSVP